MKKLKRILAHLLITKPSRTMKHTAFILTAVLLFTACSAQDDAYTALNLGSPISFALSSFEQTDDADVLVTRSKLAIEAQSEFYGLLMESTNWKEADRAVTTALTHHVDVADSDLREEVAAVMMLKLVLLQQDVTPEVQEAMSRYTTVLIDRRNPEAHVIADALERLQGYWTSEQIAEAAAVAFNIAEERLAVIYDCDGCSFQQILEQKPAEVQEQASGIHQNMYYGAERLLRLM